MKQVTGQEWSAIETRLAAGCEVCGRRLVQVDDAGRSAPKVGVRIVTVQHVFSSRDGGASREGGASVDTWDVALCGRCYQRGRHEVARAHARRAA